MNTPTKLISTAIAIAISTVLVGCETSDPNDPGITPLEPSTSETPTPTATDVFTPPTFEEPANEAQAIEDATAAANAAFAAVDALVADPTQEHLALVAESFAEPPAQQDLEESVTVLLQNDATLQGASRFTQSTGTANEATDIYGAAIPYGHVTLSGCIDYSNQHVVYRDGSTNDPDTFGTATLGQVELRYNPETGVWAVLVNDQGEQPC